MLLFELLNKTGWRKARERPGFLYTHDKRKKIPGLNRRTTFVLFYSTVLFVILCVIDICMLLIE